MKLKYPALLAALCTPVVFAADVFINEIHYDNTGADSGEAIEVAGPSGTNLTGMSLVMYNGSNGTSYKTVDLTGTIPNQQDSFGTLSFSISGIQNGSPDGVALVDTTDTVVQFLSYEGSLTAVGGPADGMSSTDIGVTESSGTAVGFSLQLGGSGNTSDDFAWEAASANTFGYINTNQIFGGGGPSVDNAPEVIGTTPADNTGVVALDADIEVSFSESVNLVGNWYDISCSLSGNHTALVSGGPQQYSLNSDADFDHNEVCTVSVFAALVNDVDVNDPPDFMEADYSFSFGTVTNSIIVINEVDADTSGSDVLEFIELFDGGVGNTPLDGLVVVLYNGSDNKSYNNAFDLDGYSTNSEGFFVLGNEAVLPAPSIVIDNNALQNGADAVALYFGNAIDYPNDTPVTGISLVDALVYDTNDSDDLDLLSVLTTGQPQINEDDANDKDFHSNSRVPDGGAALDTSVYVQQPATPGQSNVAFAEIFDIQGNGDATEVSGLVLRIEGIVVGDFQSNETEDNGDLRGFFIQSELGDGNPQTSDALFVFDNTNPDVDVAIGDKVSVIGRVSEFSGMTQVSALEVTVLATEVALPTAQTLNLPIISDQQLEALEGMRIVMPQNLSIGDYFNFDRFGEISLTLPLDGDMRMNTPTAVVEPGSNDYFDLLAANSVRKILLDDGRTSQNSDPAIHPNGQEFTLANRFRGGDTLTNVQGVMHQAFGAYRIQPTQGAEYTATNPRPDVPVTAGRLKVVSFNVLNYFTTLDQSGNRCGPSALSCRGADNAEEFVRQRDKIIQALMEINADVVGLIEIENNAEASVKDLVDGLNSAIGEVVYAYVDTGFIGTDAIKVAMLYKPASVALAGDFAVLDSLADSRFIDTLNRPALAQTFVENELGGRVTVVVNHFKSKGSSSRCEDVGDYDMNDGQGNCNGVRTDAAEALADWVATDPTNSADPDYLIIGDLNSYDEEDPIVKLQSSGFVDMVKQFGGEKAYSYVFDGQVGYLDYALASSVLAQQVSATSVWQINADEPDILDYDTSFKKDAQDALYAADAFRSSDHDPVIVGLDLYVVPRDKNQCKKGGWKNLYRNDGSEFRNQGKCVSYVNTGK